MKRIIRKIIILSIFIIFAISLKSFAQSGFRFYIKEGVKVDPGETVEIPIIIDSINIEGIEKKIISFNGTLEYDKDVFELVPYQDGNEQYIIKLNPELNDYGIQVLYHQDTGIISTTLDSERTGEFTNRMQNTGNTNIEFLNNYLEIGTVKIKAKEAASAGDYSVTITNIEGNNTEFNIYSSENYTKVHINEIKSDDTNKQDTNENSDKSNKGIIDNSKTVKKAILKIEVSKDGKKITITPDEEKGAKILTILYKGKELIKEDGKFIFESEPNDVYEFFVYAEDGTCLGNEFVTTIVNEEEGTNDETEKEDTTKNEEKEDGKKSPQTGDMVFVIVGILISVVLTLVFVEVKNRRKSA